jgi:uncharacterized protein (DUF1810 family)
MALAPTPTPEQNSAFDLSRFLFAQEDVYDTVISELRRGRKETHWMWFVFPQLDGLGHSVMARRYAIRSIEEAKAYLEHPVLGPRLLECCQALISLQGKTAAQIFGDPDDLKLRSSMTLFSRVPDAPGEFTEVLEHYFGGREDQRTLEMLTPSP